MASTRRHCGPTSPLYYPAPPLHTLARCLFELISHRFLIRFPKPFLSDLWIHSWVSAKLSIIISLFSITQEEIIETVEKAVLNFNFLGEKIKTKLGFLQIFSDSLDQRLIQEEWSWAQEVQQRKRIMWHDIRPQIHVAEFLLRNLATLSPDHTGLSTRPAGPRVIASS